MDKNIVLLLLGGQHLSIPERIELGIINHPPLEFEELVKILADTVSSQIWFPYPLQLHKEGTPVQERAVIEKISKNKFIYHQQRTYANNPFTVAEEIERVFKNPEKIARYYLKHELNLPGDLDGFKVK